MSDFLTSTPSDEEKALLEMIRAEPDALGPRIVYADWLQQRGEPLGEYISLLIGWERDDPSRAAMSKRLQELAIGPAWSTLLNQYAPTELGFISRFNLDRTPPPDLAQRLERTLIRDLFVGRELKGEQLPILSAALEKMRLRTLRMNNVWAHEILVATLMSRAVYGLESLVLYESGCGQEAMMLLATLQLPKLAHLTIDAEASPYAFPRGEDGDAENLAASPFRRKRLTELSLRRHKIGAKGASALLDGRLPLTSLDVSGNPLGDEGIRAIVESPQAAHLQFLGIAKTGLTMTSLAMVANAPSLRHLKHLVIGHHEPDLNANLNVEMVDTLVASTVLPREMTLEIDGGSVGMAANVSIDGASGQPCYSSWEGEPRAVVKERFQVKVVGYPPF